MYRVELKGASRLQAGKRCLNVPNVPCGVESVRGLFESDRKAGFLMYRVELKVQIYVYPAVVYVCS